jgi:hypothetical protein
MFRIKEIICNLTQNMSFVEIKCLGVEMNSTSSCFFFFFGSHSTCCLEKQIKSKKQ